MIQYGDVEVPDIVYERAIDACTIEDKQTDHWIFHGAKSGVRCQSQIGFTTIIDGKKRIKVVSVAKLIFTKLTGFYPYQFRRNKHLCTNKSCVSPYHFIVIPERPKTLANGKRNRHMRRIVSYEIMIQLGEKL